MICATAEVIDDLVSANRILAVEGLLDAYGHVSARVPGAGDRFVLSWACAAEVVDRSDLLVHGFDGEPVQPDARPALPERYLHAAIYRARQDVGAVCHSPMASVLPFSVSVTPLRGVIHAARFLGTAVRVWDLAHEFPAERAPLVCNLTYGASLAERLGGQAAVLLRGHGCVVVGRDPQEVVARCLAMDRNARVQLVAERLGEYIPLHMGECEDLQAPEPPLASDNRAWEYFRRRAGLD